MVQALGAGLVIPDVVVANRLEQGERAYHVRAQKRSGVVERIVVVGFGGEMDYRIGFRYQSRDQRSIGDVTLNQTRLRQDDTA